MAGRPWTVVRFHAVRHASVLLFALLLSGCCRVPRPQTGPSSAPDLVDTVRARSASLTTLRGELRADHMGPGGRVAGKVYAFAAAGGRLRFEAVSPMETPLRAVAVDGTAGSFTMTDQEGQRCVEGAPAPCLLGDAIGIDLSAAQVATALVGSVPLLRHRAVEARWHRCGYYEVDLVGEESGWREALRIAPVDGELVVTRAEVRGPEGVVLVVEHRDHARHGGLLLPRRSVIRTPASGGDLRIAWRSVELGVDLPESAWRTRCPDGFAVEEARCVSASAMPRLEEVAARPPPEEPGDEPEVEPGEGAGGDLAEELGLD